MSELIQKTMPSDNDWLRRLKNGSGAWLFAQAPNLLHMIKTLLAILLAMGLSMLFDLSKPGTAMITVTIVMQPGSGLVMAKGFYRFLGTLVGVVVSLILAACFTQQPGLFLIAGACWMALCTAGSITFRNFQSYAFVLAGYTLVIVGLPAALAPDQTFEIATTRLSEVMLGLLCAGIVSDVLFPTRLSDTVLAIIGKRFAHFSQFVQLAQADKGTRQSQRTQPDRDSMMLRLIGEVIALENLRTSSTFESATGHLQSDHLRQLNTAFMTLSTTFHSLDQLFLRLQSSGKVNTFNAIMMEYNAIVTILKTDKADIPFQLQECRQQLQERLAALRRGLKLSITEMFRLGPNHNGDALLDFDSAAALLLRFTDELRLYTRIHNAVLNRDSTLPDDLMLTAHYVNRTDPVLVVMSAFRAAVGFCISMLFWQQSGWPSGIDAVIFATVASALFAAAPSPTKTIIGFMQGAALGGLLGFVCAYYVQPGAQDFTMLCLSLAPFILFGTWLTTQPKHAGMGAGLLIFFLSYAAVGNVYMFDYVGFLNGMVGGLIGCAIAAATYMIIDPADSRWAKVRLVRALRRQVVNGCNKPLNGLLARFESGTRDLVGRFAMSHSIASEDDREVMAWLLSVFEIGRAVIHLRDDISIANAPFNNDAHMISADGMAAHQEINRSVAAIAHLFSHAHSKARNLEITLDAVLIAITACRAAPAMPNSAAVLANLHLIRTSLLEHTAPESLINNPSTRIYNAA
ncbi:FUSC family protein [Glaciimonas sp. PCH181]|uniref:FUSC family protein n=1 Tax=Glaciimonas sp. PCH181 TaxID=2133943 RepID=UPI000D39924E|nr:FUSC family protein [Glaciimonas sp. PCH181]PUA20472.1 hypothetical protein C7W93_12195 [Glaciimonas sp. PCH181]